MEQMKKKFFRVVEKFFKFCTERGFKIHALKMDLLTKSVIFCGRIVDKDGIKYNLRNIAALTNMHRPENAYNLQQSLCASKWMRGALPNYSKDVYELREILERLYNKAGKRNKRAFKLVSITVLWETIQDEASERVKILIYQSVKLAHRKNGSVIFLCSDASDLLWELIMTHIPEE